MFGMRCEACGEVRWSIIGRSAVDVECPVCGEPMSVERRYPGRHALATAAAMAERRDAPIAPLRDRVTPA
jgi:predicted RNA-binding Zn-ribbon protein involved in translation (DUF1610 family)